MKRIIITLFAALLAVAAVNAQGKKSLKAASKSLSQFKKNPFSATDALDEAKAHLTKAFEDAEISSSPKSYITKGEIFASIGDSQIKGKLLNPEAQLTEANAATEALAAYAKALEMAKSSGDKKSVKNALKGLRNIEDLLNNIGADLYSSEKYAESHTNFAGALTASDLLTSNGQETALKDEAMISEKAYFAGLTAYYAEDNESTDKYLAKAMETGTSEAPLYQILFEANNKLGNEEKALGYLQKGRELFADDSALLFSEINYYLAKGELNAMIVKLEEALAAEPENKSVILTIGQVYDQLIAKATEAGDAEKAEGYAEKALSNYQKVLALDADDFNANYSVGALYYNKAASLTPELNAAAEDFSAAGNKKYEEIKSSMAGFFDQALPYFLKADSINGEDTNTLIALKEIYVRKDDLEKSKEYKERLENLGNE